MKPTVRTLVVTELEQELQAGWVLRLDCNSPKLAVGNFHVQDLGSGSGLRLGLRREWLRQSSSTHGERRYVTLFHRKQKREGK